MNQPPRSPYHNARPLQQLLELIDNAPSRDYEDRWDRIRTLQFHPGELEFATNHALHLYIRWLSEDIRSLWPLLGGGLGPQAFNVLLDASNALKDLATDGQNAHPHALIIIPRLCKAGWRMRGETTRLIRQAAGR
jgi:hypothetical protein